MPSLELYKKIYGASHNTGEQHKLDSDAVMEETWYNDISSQTAYFYDFYHDLNPTILKDLNPIDDENKIPIDIKFLQYSSQTFDKDIISFHIQFKPSFKYKEFVNYYDEVLGDRYDAIFPVGMYVDIKDEAGKYNKWIVVGTANFYGTQFPTYEVLPCDFVVRYIFNNIKYSVSATLRSQNS